MLRHLKRLTIGAMLVAPLMAAPLHAQTATPEGTVIKNKATATYSDANNNTGYASVSDSVSVTVGFAAGVNPTSPASVTPASPSTADTIPFTLQNIGNGTDTAQAAVPTPGTGVSITGYRWNGTTYTSVGTLNTALAAYTLTSGASTIVQVIYDVGNGAGGSTIPVTLTQSSKRSPTTTASTTTNVQPPGSRAVIVTPKAQTVTQLPSNGTPYTYTFTVKNNGNSSDTYNLAASIGGTPSGAVTIVSVGGVAGTTGTLTLAAGASQTVAVGYNVAFVAAGTADKIVFTATSQASASVNDAGDVTVTVTKASVTMSKTAWKDDQVTPIPNASTVKPGDILQYKIAVTNASGAAAASSIVITDALPAQLTYLSSAGDVAANWSISQTGGTVTASFTSTLAANTTRYFWIRVQVK